MTDFIDDDRYINCTTRSESTKSDPNVWACIKYGFFKEPALEGKSLGWIVQHGSDDILKREAARLRNAGETMCDLRKRYRDHLPGCEACTHVAVHHAKAKEAPPELPPNRTRDRIVQQVFGQQC